MCSARRPADDLTARARIRDSAVVYFGRHGFQSATVRAIAADAGVSPALVLHHFGSKDGLREACDGYVTECIDNLTDHASTHLEARDLLEILSRTPELAPLMTYTIQAVTEGGAFADRLWERMVVDTEAYLRAATAAGIVRPTDDEHTRAEMLTTFKLGIYLLARYVMPPSGAAAANAATAETGATGIADGTDGNPSTPGTIAPPDLDVAAIATKFTVPAMELFTHGMFVTTDYLDALVEHQRKGTA